jgi:glycosyltransferase involved in cell wall biosynthesis
MKIALISHEGGGIASVSSGLAKSLTNKGLDVTLITGTLKPSHNMLKEDFKVRRFDIPNFPPRNLWFQILHLNNLHRILKDYSIIHGISPYSTFGLTFFRNKFPQPIITTIHESHRTTRKIFFNQPVKTWTLRDFGFNFAAFPLYDYSVYRSIKSSDVVTCCSYTLKSNLGVYHDLNLDKIHVIFNGVDFGEIDQISSPRRKGDFTILFAGRLYLSKGVTYLLDAFEKLSERLPNIHLNICGKGPLENYVKQSINKLNLKGRCSYFGYISHNKLLEQIKISDIVVFPSLQESQSMFMLEAMACEKPLVCFDLPFSREIIKHKKTGWLSKTRDVKELCDSIEILYYDTNLRESIGRNAIDYVRREHNWDIQANKYIALYEKALADKKGK